VSAGHRYELSEDTTVTLEADGSLILEVMLGDELAAVLLSPVEVIRLRAVLESANSDRMDDSA
jgi:adenine-specific DNA methylase